MKLKTHLLLFVSAGFLLFFASCGSNVIQPRNEVSNKTGWAYNDPDWGGFEVMQYIEQEAGPDQVLIEGGVFTMGNVEQDVMHTWNSIRKRVTLSSYYMDQTEVSNLNYLEYLFWLTKVYKTYPEIRINALPDTLVWRDRLSFNEPFVEYYLRHPAYQDYPVVGVSWVQANNYCQWRTDRVNEKFLVEAGVLDIEVEQKDQNNFTTDAYLAGQYNSDFEGGTLVDPEGQPRPARIEDGIMLPRFRLPTEAEWEYAALGLIGKSESERIAEYRYYPWDGHGLRNPQKQNQGLFMANFVRGKGDYMGVAGYLNDNAAPTAPVDAYWPNDFGLYNMAGNVSEWVLDVYRPLSNVNIDDFNPFRGNIFTTVVKDNNGIVALKDSTGHLRYRPMGTTSPYSDLTEEDVAEELDRYNYKVADNRNYKDGDIRSTLGPDWLGADTIYQGTNTMYNFNGKDPKTHIEATSLINDESRVYKGGSWRDGPYWLIPGTRRFMDQYRSTADIGFRCAMIRVGSPSAYGGK